MNIPEELQREKEELLKKLAAAQSSCNAPMETQYRIMLEELEKKITEAKAKQDF
jgi:putative hemolysin